MAAAEGGVAACVEREEPHVEADGRTRGSSSLHPGPRDTDSLLLLHTSLLRPSSLSTLSSSLYLTSLSFAFSLSHSLSPFLHLPVSSSRELVICVAV